MGDLVIMKHDNEKRCLWEKAEVIEILPSSDDKSRAVRLRTKNGECTRPIIKLCPLLKHNELRPNNNNSEQSQDDQTIQPEVAEVDTDRQPAASTQPDDAAARRPTRAAKAAAEEKIYIDSLHLD